MPNETSRFRPASRELTDDERTVIAAVNDQAEVLEAIYKSVKPGRYHSLALTALEESVMWIVREITG